MNKTDATFQLAILDPIERIISKLEDKQFLDCDLEWLEKKLSQYTKIACIAMNKKELFNDNLKSEEKQILNDFVRGKYIYYFKTLLDFFNSLE